MRDFRDAKAMAHTLRDALKAKSVETTHSECLELIAKTFGYENWNILSAKVEAARSGAPALSAAGTIARRRAAPVGASPKSCGRHRPMNENSRPACSRSALRPRPTYRCKPRPSALPDAVRHTW